MLRSTAEGNLSAVAALRGIKIIDSTVSESATTGIDSWYGKITVRGSTVSGNSGHGIEGDLKKVRVKDSEVSGNSLRGIINRGSVSLRNVSVIGNGTSGVSGPVVRASASILTGNGTAPTCDVSVVCADVVTPKPPRFRAVTCSTSYH